MKEMKIVSPCLTDVYKRQGVYKDYEDAFEKAVKVKEPVLPDDSTFPIYEKRYKEWCRLNEIMKTYWDEKSKG